MTADSTIVCCRGCHQPTYSPPTFRGPDSVFTESFSWLGVAGGVLVLSAWQWYVCGLCCVHLAHVTSRVAAIQAKFHENLDAHQLAFTPHCAPGKLLG